MPFLSQTSWGSKKISSLTAEPTNQPPVWDYDPDTPLSKCSLIREPDLINEEEDTMQVTLTQNYQPVVTRREGGPVEVTRVTDTQRP
jgi:hypothetical protein